MQYARLPDSLLTSDTPRYWATRVLFNGRPTTRREVLAILEAHQVPGSYIAEFLSTAEPCVTAGGEKDAATAAARPQTALPQTLVVGSTTAPTVVTGWLFAATTNPTDATQRLEDLEQQRNAMMSRKSTW